MARPWQWLLVVVGFGLLILVPPGVRLGNTGIAWCEPIGEFREQIGFSNPLTNSQVEAVAAYLHEYDYLVDEGDNALATEIAIRACEGARDDRRTLIIVAAIAVATVVVRRSVREAARRPEAAGEAEASSDGERRT